LKKAAGANKKAEKKAAAAKKKREVILNLMAVFPTVTEEEVHNVLKRMKGHAGQAGLVLMHVVRKAQEAKKQSGADAKKHAEEEHKQKEKEAAEASASTDEKKEKEEEVTETDVETEQEMDGETPDLLGSGRKRSSDPEASSSATELVVKRRCTDDRLSSSSDRLLADLMRCVPSSLLAIEDVTEERTSVDPLSERRAIAQAEANRILQADSEGSQILLGDTADARRETFLSIVRLLHPDKALVSYEDARAKKALDLSIEAFKKSELDSMD